MDFFGVCVVFHGLLIVSFLLYMQGGAVYITGTGSKGTFENCNFTSNSATFVSSIGTGVSLVVVP